MHKTLVLIKPDAFQRGLAGKIISRFEEKGLKLVGAKLMQLDDDLLSRHYAHLADKPFFGEIRDFMKSGPVLAMCWYGLDAVATVRRLCGVTLAREAAPGTIRGDFGMSIQCNLVHASEDGENAEKELALFFKDGEIFDYPVKVYTSLYSEREQGDLK